MQILKGGTRPIKKSIVPAVDFDNDNAIDLGSVDKRFRDIYIGRNIVPTTQEIDLDTFYTSNLGTTDDYFNNLYINNVTIRNTILPTVDFEDTNAVDLGRGAQTELDVPQTPFRFRDFHLGRNIIPTTSVELASPLIEGSEDVWTYHSNIGDTTNLMNNIYAVNLHANNLVARATFVLADPLVEDSSDEWVYHNNIGDNINRFNEIYGDHVISNRTDATMIAHRTRDKSDTDTTQVGWTVFASQGPDTGSGFPEPVKIARIYTKGTARYFEPRYNLGASLGRDKHYWNNIYIKKIVLGENGEFTMINDNLATLGSREGEHDRDWDKSFLAVYATNFTIGNISTDKAGVTDIPGTLKAWTNRKSNIGTPERAFKDVHIANLLFSPEADSDSVISNITDGGGYRFSYLDGETQSEHYGMNKDGIYNMSSFNLGTATASERIDNIHAAGTFSLYKDNTDTNNFSFHVNTSNELVLNSTESSPVLRFNQGNLGRWGTDQKLNNIFCAGDMGFYASQVYGAKKYTIRVNSDNEMQIFSNANDTVLRMDSANLGTDTASERLNNIHSAGTLTFYEDQDASAKTYSLDVNSSNELILDSTADAPVLRFDGGDLGKDDFNERLNSVYMDGTLWIYKETDTGYHHRFETNSSNELEINSTLSEPILRFDRGSLGTSVALERLKDIYMSGIFTLYEGAGTNDKKYTLDVNSSDEMVLDSTASTPVLRFDAGVLGKDTKPLNSVYTSSVYLTEDDDDGDGGSFYYNASDDNIRCTRDLVPSINNNYDIGSGPRKWDNIYATNPTIQSSAKKYKENIENLYVQWEDIENLNIYSYNLKSKDKKSYGVIADELVGHKFLNDLIVFDKNEVDGFRYSELIPILFSGMRNKIWDLESRINTLENIIESI